MEEPESELSRTDPARAPSQRNTDGAVCVAPSTVTSTCVPVTFVISGRMRWGEGDHSWSAGEGARRRVTQASACHTVGLLTKPNHTTLSHHKCPRLGPCPHSGHRHQLLPRSNAVALRHSLAHRGARRGAAHKKGKDS